MDLDQLDTVALATEGAVLELKHPTTGEPILNEDGTAWTITLMGADSESFRSLARHQTDRRIARPSERPTAERAFEDALDLLAAATKGWSGIMRAGEPVKFSTKAARALYASYPWVREQVDNFIADRSNFLRASSQD